MIFDSLILLFMTPILLHVVARKVYTIIPDEHPFVGDDSTHFFADVLSNSPQYFTSNTQLLFSPGFFFLEQDFIVQNVSNFSIAGNHSTIQCTNLSVGITMINVTNAILQNIRIIQCSKDHSNSLTNTFTGLIYDDMPTLHWNAALHLHYCESVVVTNVSITVDIGTDGILVVNAMSTSKLNNIHIIVVSSKLHSANVTTTKGLVIYYYQSIQTVSSILTICNFSFSQGLSYSTTEAQTIMYILLFNTKYSVSVRIYDCEYRELHNFSVLYYYSYTKQYSRFGMEGKHILHIENLQACENNGNSLTNLIIIKFYDCLPIVQLRVKSVSIFNSKFDSNLNISSVVVVDTSSLCLMEQHAQIKFSNCSIIFNNAKSAIKVNEKLGGHSRRSVFLYFRDCNISANTHNNGVNLILLNTAQIDNRGITITKNGFYESLIRCHLSTMKIKTYFNITNNYVRSVLSIADASYNVIHPSSTLTISNNIVYSALTTELFQKRQIGELCVFQFYGFITKKKRIENITTFSKIMIVNNFYTSPLHFIDLEVHFTLCRWLSNCDCAFNKYKPSDILPKLTNVRKRRIDKANIGIIPLSICRCTSATKYNCTAHNLGKLFPGQTLTVNLIIPRLVSSLRNLTTITAETTNLPPTFNVCAIVKATEMSQMHTNTGCNQYNYTVWSDKTECELYLSADGIPEIFFVTLLPCPVGFSLQSQAQGCYCDTVLDCDVISVTACNLADGTILRTANSWISANTVDGSHRYHVSSQCPFDYCLPYSSYLNLSTPDMQCQFNRFAVACGHCQQGLSAVFGSSQCKKCSNINLFNVIYFVNKS